MAPQKPRKSPVRVTAARPKAAVRAPKRDARTGGPHGDGRPGAGALDPFLQALSEMGGTDLLLTAGAQPLVRVDGQLRAIDAFGPLSPQATEALVASTLTPDLARMFAETKEVDFSFPWHDIARFRANAFRQRGSASIALRLIPYKIPTFDDLDLPPSIRRFVELKQGLVLVTGPTGSGKSTTLAAMIEHINTTRRSHILTIENPIEYVYRHKMSAVNQREVGEDTLSFASALRSALREDPDVLLVGEMRDLETIQTTLTIAETGHLVFGTLHTNDTSQAIDRIVDVFPSDRQQQIRVQLSNSLTGIVYQQLLPLPGGGRVAAFEVLVATNPVRNLIKEGKTRQLRNVIQTSQREGMQTLESSLTDLVARGVLPHDLAASVSLYPSEVRQPKR